MNVVAEGSTFTASVDNPPAGLLETSGASSFRLFESNTITFTWESTDHETLIDVVEGNESQISLSWDTTGAKVVTVTAEFVDFEPTSASTSIDIGDNLVSVSPSITGSLSYTSSDGISTTITIPGPAVSQTTSFLYTAISQTVGPPPQDTISTGVGFILDTFVEDTKLDTIAFGVPVSITIEYEDSLVTSLDEETLLLDYWDKEDSKWQNASESCVPPRFSNAPAKNRLEVGVCHLTEFALFGSANAYQIMLPFVTVGGPG